MLRWRLSSWLEGKANRRLAERIRLLRAERVELSTRLDLERRINQHLQFRLDEQAKDAKWLPAVIVWRRAEGELTQLRTLLAAARRQLALLSESHRCRQ